MLQARLADDHPHHHFISFIIRSFGSSAVTGRGGGGRQEVGGTVEEDRVDLFYLPICTVHMYSI